MARNRLPDRYNLKPDNPFHIQIMHANELVAEAMKDEGFVEILKEAREEAYFTQGNSAGRNLKHKHSIPLMAQLALPDEVQADSTLIDEWVKYHVPCLMITNF